MMDSLLTEDQYVRPFDGEKSPPTRKKWKPVSLGTVEPLVFDNTTMELADRNMNSEKQFLEKLSQGKGASLFDVKQGQLGLFGGKVSLDNESLNITDIEGCSMLHHAARCNKVDAVTSLLDNGADIDLLNSFGYTALHTAVRCFCTETVKLLLQRGANPSVTNQEKDTPLHFAARQGCIYITSMLLEDPRTDINCPNAANITPFHLACKNGDRSLCEMFLSRGADIMTKSSSSMTSLHFAASYGNVEACELLLSKVSKQRSCLKSYIDATDIDDVTALHTSCLKGYKSVVELLLCHGADYEAITTVYGHSPLQLAVTNGHSEVVELLVMKGAAINGRNGNLQTPLHKAALFNQTGTAEVLVKNGAELEARDMMDLTPFLIAVIKGSKETTELLLDLGSNLTAVDAVSNSCLHLAVQRGQVEIVQMLLKRGKERLMTLRNNDLRSVIHLAAALEDAKILEILLKERFYYEQRDVNEKLPLHIAAESGSVQCVNSLMRCKMLVIHGNDRDDHGMTPLHLAALNKHAETCALLISKGGDVAAHDDNCRTALHLAVKAGSVETVKILLNPMLPSTLEEKDADQNTALHIACMHNRLDVLKFLVDKGADVTTRNKDNMTCLDVAIECGASEVAEALVRHKRWKEVVCGNSSKDRAPPMEKLIQALPDVAEIVLDNCFIQNSLPTSHPDYTITIDVFPLDPCLNNEKRKFFAPACMATYRREKLLNHCVTQALLRWKWAILGKFLSYFNFFMFLLFVVLFTVVIVKHREVTRLSFDSPHVTSTEIPTEVKGAAIAIFVFLICETANELFQIFWLQTSYFKDVSNLVDFSLYISVTIYILPFVTKENLYGGSEVQWTAGSVGLLLCYLNIILSFRRLSGVALYVTMYIEVLQTFIKVISIFTIVIIGYALVFYVLLREQGNFSSFWMSFVKVFVMMVGEMDYSDILSEHVVNNNKVPGTVFPYVPLPVLTYIIFTLFVLTVSIILMNLLVGLAVGDIDSIQKTANLRTLVDQAFLVEKIQNRYPRWLLRRAYRSSLEIKPNRNTFANSVLLAGTSLVDQKFVDKLHAKASNQVTTDDDLDNYDQRQRENQNEIIKTLKATVEEQSKLLRAIAERLEITQH